VKTLNLIEYTLLAGIAVLLAWNGWWLT